MFGNEAALILPQVRRYREIVERVQANANVLLSSGALQAAGLRLPDPIDHIFTKFFVTMGEDAALAQAIQRRLRRAGVEFEVTYKPLHLRPPFSHFRRTAMSNIERWWQGTFAIPVSPGLDRAQMHRIIRAVQ